MTELIRTKPVQLKFQDLDGLPRTMFAGDSLEFETEELEGYTLELLFDGLHIAFAPSEDLPLRTFKRQASYYAHLFSIEENDGKVRIRFCMQDKGECQVWIEKNPEPRQPGRVEQLLVRLGKKLGDLPDLVPGELKPTPQKACRGAHWRY